MRSTAVANACRRIISVLLSSVLVGTPSAIKPPSSRRSQEMGCLSKVVETSFRNQAIIPRLTTSTGLTPSPYISQVIEALELLHLPGAQQLRWTSTEEHLITVLKNLDEAVLGEFIKTLDMNIHGAGPRLKEIVNRLQAFHQTLAEFNPASIQTWFLGLVLQLDRRSENTFRAHGMLVVSQVAGDDSPLNNRKVRKAIGQRALTALRVALAPYPEISLHPKIQALASLQAPSVPPEGNLQGSFGQTKDRLRAISSRLLSEAGPSRLRLAGGLRRYLLMIDRLEKTPVRGVAHLYGKDDAPRLEALEKAFGLGPFSLEKFLTWPISLFMTPMLEKTLRKTGPYIFEELVDPSSTFNQQRIYPGVRAGLIRKLTGVLSPFGLALPEVSRRERRAKNEGNGETETSA